MNEHRYEYDILRIMACICVVTIHVLGKFIDIPIKTLNWNIMNFCEILTRFSVCIFFMISGALFLQRDTIDIKRLFKKNISKLIFFYFSWALIYFCYSLKYSSYENIDEVLSEIVGGGGAYQLWFVPALIMVYLWFPILANAIHGKKIDVFYMICICGLSVLYKTIEVIPDCPKFVLTFIDTFSTSYYVYIIYALLGYYLSTKKIESKRGWLIVIFIINSIIFSFLSYKLCVLANESIQSLYVYMTIPQFVNAICVFAFFISRKKMILKSKTINLVKYVSDSTLGVYGIHILILVYALNNICWPSAENNIFAFLIYDIGIVCVSFFIIFIIKKIPIFRKVLC